MGNHEHPCIVCGENTMSAFNYDCERRHSAKHIRAAIAETSRYCRSECKEKPCDYHQEKITELASLLMKREKADAGTP